MVHINDTTFLSATTAPSGGVKAFRRGKGGGGRPSMDEYTEIKWLTMQTKPRRMPFDLAENRGKKKCQWIFFEKRG